jgi:hypothetical protein
MILCVESFFVVEWQKYRTINATNIPMLINIM